MRGCDRCGGVALEGERFCKECRKDVLNEMRQAGYLQRVPGFVGSWNGRTADHAENRHETKYGCDY